MPRLHPTRVLCLDFGDRRIGVAVGSSETGVAAPLETIDRSPGTDAVLKRLRELVRREGAGTIVVGDPINMDGSRGERSKISHEFAETLEKGVRQTRVEMCDERLSSFAADEWMERDGVKPARRREMRDAYAAAVILSDYLEESGRSGGETKGS
ncbi:Holliday junction resolvase RuvX [Candidatus Sumerlaeota bacterium]|nr:Holliday junction resolvase RuvX [Candidatus Sumerlaeota bacterium]